MNSHEIICQFSSRRPSFAHIFISLNRSELFTEHDFATDCIQGCKALFHPTVQRYVSKWTCNLLYNSNDAIIIAHSNACEVNIH